MVEIRHREVLQGELDPEQFASIDSNPPRLSHVLGFAPGAQVMAVFSVISFALVFLFQYAPVFLETFPERDLYFSRYTGGYSVPMRIFIISFYLAFASAIAAPWMVRLVFAVDILIPFLFFCALMDIGNAIFSAITGTGIPITAMAIASGIAGFLIFSRGLLRCADMPTPSRSPIRARFKTVAFFTVSIALLVSGALAIWIGQMHLQAVGMLRDMALLGGVSVGVFLLIPLLFYLLNIYAAIQSLFRIVPNFAPDITVIIPAYNEERSIAAIVDATDKAAGVYEGKVTLLIIDNRSSDQTREAALAAFTHARHMTCELVEETRPGKAWALNRGLDLIETEFFARLDADTLLHPNALKLAFRHFGHEHVGVVGGVALPPGGGRYDGARLIEIILKLGYDQVAFGAADIIFGVPGMFACYRTEAAREVGGFAHGINGEDTDIALRIGEAGHRLVIDPDALFISEVPRTFAHLREQRHRWFRSIFHATARNQHLIRFATTSIRGRVIIPFMLANTARRAMSVPLLLYAINFLALHPDPHSTIHTASVLALLLGAPLLTAIIAIAVNLRFDALVHLPSYIGFRVLRAYLTLESLLSMSFNQYTRRILGEDAMKPVLKSDPAHGPA